VSKFWRLYTLSRKYLARSCEFIFLNVYSYAEQRASSKALNGEHTPSTIGGIMINGIRQQAIVGKGGRIEVLSPELPMGARVEIIVLIDEPIKQVYQANTTLTPKPSNRKPFTIRKFSLGKEVNVDRNELYAERISI